jgi:2-amino-4-hydroxy-6-hydroxymethyldihydropteridine diphosphokinase
MAPISAAGEHAFIGIGSNLADPEQQVLSAIEQLSALPHSELRNASGLYRSRPMGPSDQPDYVNAVAELVTDLGVQDLLAQLQAIERKHGRDRSASLRWGPRTLDLDILVFGALQIQTDKLTIPHAGIAERNFVLYPLAEIAPAVHIPGLADLPVLLARCPPTGLERITRP